MLEAVKYKAVILREKAGKNSDSDNGGDDDAPPFRLSKARFGYLLLGYGRYPRAAALL